MEPIIGLFFLIGLIFDIIGACLLVSVILSFKTKWTPELLENKDEVFEYLPKFISDVGEIVTGTSKDRAIEIVKDSDVLIKLCKDYIKLFNKEKEKQEKEFSKNRAYGGLTLLIIGFALQIFGVIFQLF